jgi:hypothetical protein
LFYIEKNGDACRVVSIPFLGGASSAHATLPLGSGGACSHISISPEGKRLAYQQFEGDNVTVYISGVDGSNPVAVFLGFGWYHWCEKWSPDGRRLAIQGNALGETPGSGDLESNYLYIIHLADVIRIRKMPGSFPYAVIDQASWSPGSRWLLIRYVWSGGVTMLDTTDEKGQYASGFTSLLGFAPLYWSPDSRFFAYISFEACEHPDMDMPSGIFWQGPDAPEKNLPYTCDDEWLSMDIHPLWTPDGSGWIVASKNPRELVHTGMDGHIQTRLAPITGLLHDLQWSPDGEWLIYMESRTLKAVRLDGTANRVLANGLPYGFTVVP